MKKVFLGLVLLCSFIGLSFAQDTSTVDSAPAVETPEIVAEPTVTPETDSSVGDATQALQPLTESTSLTDSPNDTDVQSLSGRTPLTGSTGAVDVQEGQTVTPEAGSAIGDATQASQQTAIEAVTATTSAPALVSLSGTFVDNMCAIANKEKLADFVKTHPKECAVKPECAASGYSLYADGVLYALDSESNLKVTDFLKVPENKLEVSVEGKLIEGKLSIISIKN